MKLAQVTSTALAIPLVKPLSIALLSLGLSLVATTARAFTFSTIGTWDNAIGGNVDYVPGPENRVFWGEYTPQSGLGFSGSAGTGDFGSTLPLGTLRHFNNPVGFIELTVPQSVDLTVAFNLVIDGQTIARNFTYTLNVNETPDELSCPYVSQSPGCPDAVSWRNTVSSNAFAIGDRDYTLELLGFSNTLGGSPVNQFISEERSTNQTLLYGRVVETTATVPEPTTLVGVGLAGLGLSYARRRRKR